MRVCGSGPWREAEQRSRARPSADSWRARGATRASRFGRCREARPGLGTGAEKALGHASLFEFLCRVGALPERGLPPQGRRRTRPRHVPSTRMVVTRVLDLPVVSPAGITQPLLALAGAFAATNGVHPDEVPPWRFPTSGIADRFQHEDAE